MYTNKDDENYYVNQETLSTLYFARQAKGLNKPKLTETGRETLDYLRRLLQTEKPTET